jgi:hypothetical protein
VVLQRGFTEGTGRNPAKEILLHKFSNKQAFAMGFRNFLADVTWLQAVQVAGNREMTPEDYETLFVLLNTVANYDPRYDVPYILGGLILGESPNHSGDALAILSRGKVQFPTDWRFPFYMGFTHYFSLGDGFAGGKAMAEAARLPGSPAYLPGLASRMLSEARSPEAGLALLRQIAEQETDVSRRAVLERRLRELEVERDLQALERAIERYRETFGVGPGELADLIRAGILARLPTEPNGGRYLLGPGGSVRSDRVPERFRVFRK